MTWPRALKSKLRENILEPEALGLGMHTLPLQKTLFTDIWQVSQNSNTLLIHPNILIL